MSTKEGSLFSFLELNLCDFLLLKKLCRLTYYIFYSNINSNINLIYNQDSLSKDPLFHNNSEPD